VRIYVDGNRRSPFPARLPIQLNENISKSTKILDEINQKQLKIQN